MVKTVFENDSFLVVDKPAGWLTVESRLGASDTRPCLFTFLRGQGAGTILPVHRLDEPVSGIVLFAKTARAHREANAWFEGRLIAKKYEAATSLSDSVAAGAKFRWESQLVRGKKRAFEANHGKIAITEALFEGPQEGKYGLFGRWLLYPLTGRSHQLRFELSKRGFPILGDTLYGGRAWDRKEEIALRAIELTFPSQSLGMWKLPAKVSVNSNLDLYR